MQAGVHFNISWPSPSVSLKILCQVEVVLHKSGSCSCGFFVQQIGNSPNLHILHM